MYFSPRGLMSFEVLPVDTTDEKGELTKAAMLLALMSPGYVSKTQASIPSDSTKIELPVSKEDILSKFPTDMDGILRHESQYGKYTNHKVVNYGINKGDRAIGYTGLMPITVRETIRKNPRLDDYKFVLEMTNNEMTDYLNQHPEIEADIAKAHWDRLTKIFGDNLEKKVYAWNQGITGAKQATDDEISNHKYVLKVMNKDIKLAQR